MMTTPPIHPLRAKLWSWQPHALPLKLLTAFLRTLDALIASLVQGELSLRALSLVYTSLISIVPVLAIGFSLLKALGLHTTLEPFLLQSLKGLGPAQAAMVSHNLMRFVDNIQVGVIGSLGLVFLLFSAMSLIHKIDNTFNFIWRVDSARGIAQRLGEYVAVIVVTPTVIMLLLTALRNLAHKAVETTLQTAPILHKAPSFFFFPCALRFNHFYFCAALCLYSAHTCTPISGTHRRHCRRHCLANHQLRAGCIYCCGN